MNFANFFLSFSLIFSLSIHGYSLDKDPEKTGNIKQEIKKYIAHHLKDSHSFGFASYTNENDEKVYLEIPLLLSCMIMALSFLCHQNSNTAKK